MSTIKKTIYYSSLIITIIYLIYRIFYTLPNSSMIFAILVLIIEIIDAIFFMIYVLNILVIDYKIPNIPKLLKKDYPELDIFIATVNEDVDLLNKTIKSVKKMKYPSKKKLHIYLCDDGNREEIKLLSKREKIGYITRNNNKYAKAGNYNNALNNSNSPYIVVFDADMNPKEDFLLKTVPYLYLEENIGFIQLPQSFINNDIFQNKYKLEKYIPFEQDYFYHRIQISRNKNNSVIFCGTNAILSRKALVDIGGFATHTITEDFATGLLIEGHGFKGIALPYNLAYGVNVEDTSSLIKQRSRWCRGCIQTYKNYKILTNKGLNIRQKLDYLSGIYYWFFGIRNIIYLLIPLLYSFFNIKIIQGNIKLFLILFIAQYIIKRFIIDKLEDNKVSSTWNRIYEIILSPVIFMESLLEFIGFSYQKFEVTLKNKKSKKSIKYYYLFVSHILLFLLNLLGIYISFIKGYKYGFIEFLIPLFWLSNNVLYLIFALIFDFSHSNSFVSNRDTNISKYNYFSSIILIFKFIKDEVKIKGIAIVLSIILLIVGSVSLNNYYEYKKDVVINKKSLVSYNKWLSLDNGNIVNNKKEIVKLRGISSHNLNWYGRIYTKENLKEIRDTWGVNIFRIAMYTNPLEEGYINNKDIINDVEKIIDYCIDLNIYIIVDWHILKDNNPNTYKKEAIDFFDRISKKYADIPNVIYEICNEPNGLSITWDKIIKPYATDLIKIIRKNSNKSLIIVGLADWSKDIKSAKNNMLNDKNTLYSVHFYAGDINDNKLKNEIINAKKEGMPLIVTECGATEGHGDGKLYKDNFNEWINLLENNNVSWIVWQLSEKEESSSLLIKKEVQDRLDVLYEKYTEDELKKKKYKINDYLSDTGKYIRKLFIKYNKQTK